MDCKAQHGREGESEWRDVVEVCEVDAERRRNVVHAATCIEAGVSCTRRYRQTDLGRHREGDRLQRSPLERGKLREVPKRRQHLRVKGCAAGRGGFGVLSLLQPRVL